MRSTNENKESVAQHFDAIAPDYDFWKKKNWYYYHALKEIARAHTPPGAKVLDVGCGTGTILASLKIKRGVGIDISAEMIAIAKERYKNFPHLYFFLESDFKSSPAQEKFDRVLFFDVIEHVSSPQEAMRTLRHFVADDGLVIISMANPFWEPILIAAEKLGLKMPEGPHHRISVKNLIKIAQGAGLILQKRDYRLFMPKFIPYFSRAINAFAIRTPFLRSLCLIQVFVFGPDTV